MLPNGTIIHYVKSVGKNIKEILWVLIIQRNWEKFRMTKGNCFNKERIKSLRDAWEQYNMEWSSIKEDVPKELYEIIEEIICRLEEKE